MANVEWAARQTWDTGEFKDAKRTKGERRREEEEKEKEKEKECNLSPIFSLLCIERYSIYGNGC